MDGASNLNEVPAPDLRLTPAMASLRLLVLRFVRQYLTSWSASPSYGEIAAALGTNRTRVRKAVKSLSVDGLLLRTPGPRGLILPDDLTEAARLLALHGYRVEPAAHRRVTHSPLQDDPVLDYFPGGSAGARGNEGGGSEDEGGERSFASDGCARAQSAQQLGEDAPDPRGRGAVAAA
jgi:biotin operon repressor